MHKNAITFRKKQLYTTRGDWSLFLLFLPLIYVFAGNMISVYSTVVPYRDIIRILIVMTGTVIFIFKLIRNPIIRKDSIFIPLLLFSLFTIPFSFFKQSSKSILWAIGQTCDSVLWITVFVIAYYIARKWPCMLEKSRWYACLIFLFSFLFLGVKDYSQNTGIALISTAYYSLFLIPFALMIKNVRLKWVIVLVAFSTIILSVKRTGFIAAIIMLIVYFVVDFKVNQHGSLRKLHFLIGGCVFVLLSYVIIVFYIQEHSIDIIFRLQNILLDDGSGRTKIWAETLRMIKDSNPIDLIFGHGFNAVYIDSKLSLSAHTDFLEVIYDYGIVGTMLYIQFYIRLLKYLKKLKYINPKIVPAFASSLVLVFIVSVSSHLLIYPTYFIWVCILWGLIVGYSDTVQLKERNML